MPKPVRVLIVDDSTFMRRAVERMLADSPAITVVGTAANGEEAVARACELHPDIIVLDVDMPEMDGLEALQHIMATCPTPVVMLSTLTRAGTEVTIRALELGAVDFLDKSQSGTAMDIHQLGPKLRDKVLAVAGTGLNPAVLTTSKLETALPKPAPPPPHPAREVPVDIVAIGASTGGPRALTEVLPRLPADLGAAIVVAQHMPAGFTATLAERLNERCAITVREARDGELLEPGVALIAPGGMQMEVVRRGGGYAVRVFSAAPDTLHHPSVDLLFHSVAAVAEKRAVGVVLTGMGHDGAEGLRAMQAAGAQTVVESAETAVIDGMPGAARPYAGRVLPLPRIAQALAEICAQRAVRSPGED